MIFFAVMMNEPDTHKGTPQKMAGEARGIFGKCRASLLLHSREITLYGGQFFQCVLKAAIILVLLFSTGKAAEYGILPSLPKEHFEGVDKFGVVSIWKQIGKIDVGGGLQIPLNLNFRSDHIRSSPLGEGWSLAILDANIVQIDENTFRLRDPNGRVWHLRRDENQPNKLVAKSGWNAEISQDMIIVWKMNGMKLGFKRGSIISLQTKGRAFKYIYENGQAVGLQEGSKVLFKIETTFDPLSKIISLSNFKNIKLKMSERPVFQNINGVKVISRKEQILSECELSDGSTLAVTYGADDQMKPSIEIDGHLLTWNPSNARIISAGDWSYDIIPDKNPTENAKISRKNSAGDYQSWHLNKTLGVEIVINNGIETRKEWFTTGLLVGKFRKILQRNEGKTRLIEQYFYDEKAQPIRIKREQTDTFWVREPDGSLAALVQNGKLLHTYTENGAKLAQKFLTENEDAQ